MTAAKKPQPTVTAEGKPAVVSMATKLATAALDEAGKVLAERRRAADVLAVAIHAAQTTVAALDALPELTTEQVVEQANVQRRLRKLRADHAVANAQVVEASRPVAVARRKLDAARLVDADHELQQLDRQFVERARVFSAELGSLRRVIFQKLQIANALYRSLRPPGEMFDDTPRSTVAGLGSPGDDPLEAAVRAIRTLESRRRALADQAQIGRNPVYPYRPARDEHGNFD